MEHYLDNEIDQMRKKLDDSYIDPEFKNQVLQFLLEGRMGIPKATEMICSAFLKINKVYTIRDDNLTEMWIYKEGIYIPEGKSFIKEFCREVLEDSYKITIVNMVIAKIEVDTFIEMKTFFSIENPWEIAVKNGILNTKTRVLTDFTHEKRFFTKINAEYKEGAKIDKIGKFLEDILDKEDVPVIQEMVGFVLVRKYFLENAFMLLGSGANGKTRLLTLIENFLHSDNCVSVPLHQLLNEQFAMGELHNKMVNISGDISNKTLNETGLFKQITGSDPITGNRKYKTRLTFTNHAKLINSCNELPKTRDSTHGFFRRWVLIEFKNRFVKAKEFEFMLDDEKKFSKIANPDIIQEIMDEEEMSGMLNWALDGLKRLIMNNGFSYNQTAKEVKLKWLRLSNSFHAFFMDKLKKDHDEYETKGNLRQAYSKYCHQYDLKPENDKFIKQTMEDSGCWEERKRIDEERVSCWCGISLKK